MAASFACRVWGDLKSLETRNVLLFFFLVLTDSMSLWHFKVQVISVHQGDVNLSVFQSQDIFQLLLPQRSLPQQWLQCPWWIQQALQCQQDFSEPVASPSSFSFSHLHRKSQSFFKRWGFCLAFSNLSWEQPGLCFCFFIFSRKEAFILNLGLESCSLGNLSWCWSHSGDIWDWRREVWGLPESNKNKTLEWLKGSQGS